MKTNKLLFTLVIMWCATAAQAEMYKWVGADGKVTYSDTPPPSSAKKVERKSLSGSGPDTSGLPYELAEAVKNSPVKLYTGDKCAPCDEARKFLNTRGIPFTEKTVSTNKDAEQLRQVSGDTQLPVLTIGRNKQNGYEAGAWDAALSNAGYPSSNMMPKNYRNGNIESAAPEAKPKTEEQAPQTNPSVSPPPPPAGNAPPGFRF